MKRVLYVEDEPALGEIFKAVLEARGYSVDVALNGHDGIEMHTTDPYDIVALDYQLPDMSGLDIAREFFSRNSELPVILITGRGNEEVAAEALDIGVSNYIVKDTQSSYLDLLPAVIAHLERRLEMTRVMKAAEKSLRASTEQLQAQLVTQIDTAERYEQQAGELAGLAEELASAQDDLDDYANHDELTGLPNRRLCLDRIENSLGMSRRDNTQVAVIAVTLTSGNIGNVVPKEVARRLGNLIREGDTVSRFENNGFIIVLTNLVDRKLAETVAKRANLSLSEPIGRNGETVSVDVITGIALFPDDGTTAEGLIDSAIALSS